MQLDAPTATTVVLVNEAGDRQFLHRLGASQAAFAKPSEFTPALVEGASHYHFASLYILPHLRVHGAEMLRRAKTAGLTTSLDTNWDAEGEWMSALAPCLEQLDILFMNEDEALYGDRIERPAAGARVVLGKGSPNRCHEVRRPRMCHLHRQQRDRLSRVPGSGERHDGCWRLFRRRLPRRAPEGHPGPKRQNSEMQWRRSACRNWAR